MSACRTPWSGSDAVDHAMAKAWTRWDRLDDRDVDDQVAQRLRRATAGMWLPTTTTAQAKADGQRLLRRTRVLASTGVVAVIVCAVGVVLALQPLGAADVVHPPPPVATAEACATPAPVERSTQPRGLEARLEPAGITGWALLFSDAPPCRQANRSRSCGESAAPANSNRPRSRPPVTGSPPTCCRPSVPTGTDPATSGKPSRCSTSQGAGSCR